jgi:hypothetical protein
VVNLVQYKSSKLWLTTKYPYVREVSIAIAHSGVGGCDLRYLISWFYNIYGCDLRGLY